jgi:archaellum component FlaF (FlaF/FlaG flagellin family)
MRKSGTNGKWYVPDEGEISENELVDILDDGILVIKSSTKPQGAYTYLIPSNIIDIIFKSSNGWRV